VATGERVARAAARDLKRVTLELGGNDAAILLPDVYPARVVEDIFWGAFLNNGQVCSAIKRLFVHERQFKEIVRRLAERAEAAPVGNGMDPHVALGPLGNAPQLARVVELVEDARRSGATVVTGGHCLAERGYFFAPTILTGVDAGIRVVDEEQFGPVLPVLSYREVDEAVARANATSFGLSGSVWSRNPRRALTVASALECGTVWVNQHLVLLPEAPFGGMKSSGLGVENGSWGLESYTQLQTVHVKR
jgi:acyl-CoA reductase-like NAD-dependent aldehyde dehydrogenase